MHERSETMRCVRALSVVMPALSRPKDGVASLAYVAGIHVFLECRKQDVDGRDKPGHDDLGFNADKKAGAKAPCRG
jgi:hypothetical protein